MEWEWETELGHLDVLGVEMEEGADIQLAPDLKIIFQVTEKAINAPGVRHHWGFQSPHFKMAGNPADLPRSSKHQKGVSFK